MRIDLNTQAVYDFDWFAVDSDGYVVHFAAAGTKLPESVAASQEELAQLKEFFDALPEKSSATLVSGLEPGLDYSDFTGYAQRGLFSFDNDEPCSLCRRYHVVARPTSPLMLAELPPVIAAIISRTSVADSVVELLTIDSAAIS